MRKIDWPVPPQPANGALDCFGTGDQVALVSPDELIDAAVGLEMHRIFARKKTAQTAASSSTCMRRADRTRTLIGVPAHQRVTTRRGLQVRPCLSEAFWGQDAAVCLSGNRLAGRVEPPLDSYLMLSMDVPRSQRKERVTERNNVGPYLVSMCPQISSLEFSLTTARGTAPNVLPANLAFWSCLVITGHGFLFGEVSVALRHWASTANTSGCQLRLKTIFPRSSASSRSAADRLPPSETPQLSGSVIDGRSCRRRSLCLLEMVLSSLRAWTPEMDAAMLRGVTTMDVFNWRTSGWPALLSVLGCGPVAHRGLVRATRWRYLKLL